MNFSDKIKFGIAFGLLIAISILLINILYMRVCAREPLLDNLGSMATFIVFCLAIVVAVNCQERK